MNTTPDKNISASNFSDISIPQNFSLSQYMNSPDYISKYVNETSTLHGIVDVITMKDNPEYDSRSRFQRAVEARLAREQQNRRLKSARKSKRFATKKRTNPGNLYMYKFRNDYCAGRSTYVPEGEPTGGCEWGTGFGKTPEQARENARRNAKSTGNIDVEWVMDAHLLMKGGQVISSEFPELLK